MLTSLSGFPEWLPEEKLVEQQMIEILRQKFELYGFAPLETRAVEPLEHLLMKGETDKEIYVLRRLQADSSEPDTDLGLHFDLTVPFARFVVENRGKLVFPFRRYQIQKSWRGERPGFGRFREFLQADFDIISENALTMQSDFEIIDTLKEILLSLPIPKTRLVINHRRLLQGFYLGSGIEDPAPVLRIVDKLDKIGLQGVQEQLVETAGLTPGQAERCLLLGQIKTNNPEALVRQVASIGVDHPWLREGLHELEFLLREVGGETQNLVQADLSLARGLDYYTGMVVEARFAELPRYPSIAGGGRYDNLASRDATARLPGTGVTIGISRILGVVLQEGLLQATRKTPSCVLVALVSEERRSQSIAVAKALRERGIACEIHENPDRFGKQIRYADRRGIPFVWFPGEGGSLEGEIKDIRSGIQVPANAAQWEPPADDRKVRIVWSETAYQELLRNPAYLEA
jgi:histidyl-tRNA synthetase